MRGTTPQPQRRLWPTTAGGPGPPRHPTEGRAPPIPRTPRGGALETRRPAGFLHRPPGNPPPSTPQAGPIALSNRQPPPASRQANTTTASVGAHSSLRPLREREDDAQQIIA